MRTVLQRRIYGADSRLHDMRIEYCKQHLSTKRHLLSRASLDVCFRNRVARDGITETHFVYIKAWLDGRSESVYDALNPASLVPVEFGSPVTHLHEHDAVAWSFPNDPMLQTLPAILGTELAADHLAKSSSDGKTDARRSAPAGPSVMRYKPEHHCVTRHEIRNDRSQLSATRARFAKTFADLEGTEPSAQRLYGTMHRLTPRFAVLEPALEIAQALRVDNDTNSVWFRELRGVPAASVIRAGNASRVLSLAAMGLACVHDCDIPGAHEITPADLLQEAKKKAAKLRLLLSSRSLIRSLDDVEALVVSQSSNDSKPLRCTIHGDFHLGQLLVCPQGVGLLDFDDVRIGDPSQDLAEFVVDLHCRGLSFHRVESLTRCLLRAYRDATTFDIAIERLRWHVQIQCLEKAWHVIGSHSPGALATCQHALELASSITFGCRR